MLSAVGLSCRSSATRASCAVLLVVAAARTRPDVEGRRSAGAESGDGEHGDVGELIRVSHVGAAVDGASISGRSVIRPLEPVDRVQSPNRAAAKCAALMPIAALRPIAAQPPSRTCVPTDRAGTVDHDSALFERWCAHSALDALNKCDLLDLQHPFEIAARVQLGGVRHCRLQTHVVCFQRSVGSDSTILSTIVVPRRGAQHPCCQVGITHSAFIG